MFSLISYLESEFATFDEKPLGEVDAAVFSQAAMLNGEGIVPSFPRVRTGLIRRLQAVLDPGVTTARFVDLDRAERYTGMFTGLVPDDIKRCLHALVASPRFRDVALSGFSRVVDETSHTQFMATTYIWRDAFACVSFAGTDASRTGWREDLDMAYRNEVGAQRLAREYLERAASRLSVPLNVCGHSKGGNLALYAALTCSDETRARIAHVWTLDAPGFVRGRFGEDDYRKLDGKVSRIVPEESTVGMLLSCPIEAAPIVSSASGLEQHSAFTWQVTDGLFTRADHLSDYARSVHEVVEGWLADMGADETRRVVEAIDAAITAAGVEDIGDLFRPGQDIAGGIVEASKRMEPSSREVLGRALGDLAARVMRRLGDDVAASLPWVRRRPAS